MTKCKERIEMLEDRIVELEEERDEARADASNFEDQLDDALADYNNELDRNSELEETIEDLKNQIQDLKDEIKNLS